MLKEWFTFQSWDQQNTAAFTFCDAILLKDIGPFKAGEKIQSIFVDYETGKLEIYNDPALNWEKPDATFTIRMIIG